MEITRDLLEQHRGELGRRLAQLQQQQAQIQAQIYATDGALRMCVRLLEWMAASDEGQPASADPTTDGGRAEPSPPRKI